MQTHTCSAALAAPVWQIQDVEAKIAGMHSVVVASLRDLSDLATLTRACITRMREQGIDQWDDVYPDEALLARDIAAGTVHLLKENAATIGTVTLDANFDPLWADMAWTHPIETARAIHRLMIHPSHQGRGLSKTLMTWTEATARAQGATSIRLDCFLANPASLRLYESLGYQRVGTATMRKGEFVGFEKALSISKTA
jgi:GNAT superfamily N-acetyltransferase